MLIVANTFLANTFDYWRNRTNEIAYAISTCVITTDANTNTLPAPGNAAITGSFTANNLIITNSISTNTISSNVVVAATLSVNSISLGNVAANGTVLTVGNTTINTSINSTAVSISNPLSNLNVTVPTATQVANGYYYFNANGSWSIISVPYLTTGSTNTIGLTTQSIDTFSTVYNAAEYLIYVNDNNSNSGYTTKLLIMNQGGSNAFITEYGGLQSNNNLGYFSASAGGGIISVFFTPSTTSASVKFLRTTV
jgi:hypothetical protein